MRTLLVALLLGTGLGAGAAGPPPVCPSIEFTDRQAALVQYWTWQRLRDYAPPPAPRAREAGVRGAIPVAFHVLHDGEEGRVSREQVEAQMAVLNEAFAPAVFVLAHLDYTDHPEWFRMRILSRAEFACKQALALDPGTYLNVYTCDTTPWLLGWGIFPFLAGFVPGIDGVTVYHASLPGGSEPGHDEGDTLVHEVGHWAGLFHTFQGRCGPLGDLVADTPAEQSPGYGCEPGRDTCPQPGLDPIDNYMDYSDDACATRFTPGQFARMAASLAAFRPRIWSLLVQGLPPAPGD